MEASEPTVLRSLGFPRDGGCDIDGLLILRLANLSVLVLLAFAGDADGEFCGSLIWYYCRWWAILTENSQGSVLVSLAFAGGTGKEL